MKRARARQYRCRPCSWAASIGRALRRIASGSLTALPWGRAARTGAIVTMGIPPTRPETGFGYIKATRTGDAGGMHPGVYRVSHFVEKPKSDGTTNTSPHKK